jgi:hypothetical protein
MKHATKSFRKKSKAESTKLRKGYERIFPGSKGKVLAKESKKAHKKQHEKFKSVGGTRQAGMPAYKKK